MRFLLMPNTIISAITYLVIQVPLCFYSFLINTLPRHQTIFWSRFWNNYPESVHFPYQLTRLEGRTEWCKSFNKEENKATNPLLSHNLQSGGDSHQCWQEEMRLKVDWLENALAIGRCSEAMQQAALVLITFYYTHFLWHKQNEVWFIFDGSSPHQF